MGQAAVSSLVALFDDLSDNCRNWGQLIEPIIAAYSAMDQLQQADFRGLVCVRKAYTLMAQYTGEIRRNVEDYSNEQLLTGLVELFIVLAIDDYRFDYRETLLRLKSVCDAVLERIDPDDFIQIWLSSKHHFSEAAICRTQSQFTLWYPDFQP